MGDLGADSSPNEPHCSVAARLRNRRMPSEESTSREKKFCSRQPTLLSSRSLQTCHTEDLQHPKALRKALAEAFLFTTETLSRLAHRAALRFSMHTFGVFHQCMQLDEHCRCDSAQSFVCSVAVLRCFLYHCPIFRLTWHHNLTASGIKSSHDCRAYPASRPLITSNVTVRLLQNI